MSDSGPPVLTIEHIEVLRSHAKMWARTKRFFDDAADLVERALRIDQKPNGCTLACIATLTGIPLDEFPHPPADADDDWFESADNRNSIQAPMHTILVQHGWFLCHLWKRVPAGFAIAGGTSPRGVAHSVVVLDGALWHDPHPSRAGLVRVDGYDVLVRLADKGRTPSGDGTPR